MFGGSESMRSLLQANNVPPLKRKPAAVFQLNIGLYCNQACHPCPTQHFPAAAFASLSDALSLRRRYLCCCLTRAAEQELSVSIADLDRVSFVSFTCAGRCVRVCNRRAATAMWRARRCGRR